MKKVNLFYWIVTGLMSAFILLGALLDAVKFPDAVELIKHLGYPEYFVPFIGVMKILAIITILAFKFPKFREWAYAGLVFDVTGALYSHLSVGDGPNVWMPALLSLILISASYYLMTLRNKTVKAG